MGNNDCPEPKVCSSAGECEYPCWYSPYEYLGLAVPCLEDAHCNRCGENYICSAYLCMPYQEECGACLSSEKPHCLIADGSITCEECTMDQHCTVGRCEQESHTCKEWTPPPGGIPCGQCLLDGHCPSQNPMFLKCDSLSGCCYNKHGSACDGQKVNCKGGRPCFKGAIGPLPPPDPYGVCQCDEPFDNFNDALACKCDGCPASEPCQGLSVCMYQDATWSLMTPPETPFKGPGICIGYSTLFGDGCSELP